MVFLCMQETLDKLLQEDFDDWIEKTEWFLFDRNIKNRSLTPKGDIFGNGNSGNLRCYMDRISYYPITYKEPLHAYLMYDSEFRKLNLLTERYKNTAYIWNMKRVSDCSDNSIKYPVIPYKERIFGKHGFEDKQRYIYEKFKELSEQKNSICHVVLGD